MFLAEPDSEFLEKRPVLDCRFRILYTIGEGRFAKVKIALDTEDDKTYAIKIMRESQINTSQKLENFMKEVQLLAEIQHSNVIQIKYCNLNGNYTKYDGRIFKVVYYVMSFAEYGEMYSFLQFTPVFSENVARFYFRQLIEGIEFLHKNNIGHRDIKTENLLLDENYQLKIADFGYASRLINEHNEKILFASSNSVGSPEYNPPEVTNSSVHEFYKAENLDLFASATMLFMMVMKSAPFHSSNYQDQYYSRLCKADKTSFWKIFASLNVPSQDFKDLIEKMLACEPLQRLTLKEIKEHSWFNGPIPKLEEIIEEMKNRGQSVLENRRNELLNKRESKILKMKNIGKRNDAFKDQNISNRTNATIDQFKLKYLDVVDEINKKLKKNIKIQQTNNFKTGFKMEHKKDIIEGKKKKKREKKKRKDEESEFLKNKTEENRKLQNSGSDSSPKGGSSILRSSSGDSES